ncbi:periodic tryptophan protein 2 [Mitosporidium daphniae]|uniref:Periodic tryptophan protein 2 n=1 Tax=Mitosporidium daphniae TaxID=1485682 RepID=A0A098VNK3_9MICR|nr:periodic tryptophan protein 2 [Mitosporidium daphniae]KGG50657.1 periodic tryptophan protein 2 [Mitosporidium daphniae]|eukprot:XP_013237141.1 periodic tryptophan protein 2 [Mitosporidium daphniae]
MTSKLLLVTKRGSKFKYHPYTLSGHKDPLVGAYFTSSLKTIVSVSQEGALFHWRWISKDPSETSFDNVDGADNFELNVSGDQRHHIDAVDSDDLLYPSSLMSTHRWGLAKREFMNLMNRVVVTASAFCASRDLLVVGLSNGVFTIYDLSGVHNPENTCVVLQSISAFQAPISSVSLSARGEWIGLATKEHGELTVWEWGSESFQLRQKSIAFASPSNTSNLLATSARGALAINLDGSIIASSSSRDGGVILWDAMTNFSFITLGGQTRDSETKDANLTTSLAFCKRGKVIVAGFQDGTIRAFDLLRYRNFRTLSMPPSSMGPISLLAADPLGELVAATTETPVSAAIGAPFSIFVWSISTGNVVDVLGGHQSTITALVIDPIAGKWIITGSMDKTVRLWDILGSSSEGGSATATAVITLGSEVLAISARPDASEVAISLLSGAVIFCDTESLTQISSIEPDAMPRGSALQLSKAASTNCFRTLTYSPDSALLFAAGSCGVISVFGMEAAHRPYLKGIPIHPAAVPSPSTSSDVVVIETLVASGSSISALVQGEGIYVFSLDESLMFDPFDLSFEVTSTTALATLMAAIGENKDPSMATTALVIALKLNDVPLQNHMINTIGASKEIPIRAVSALMSPSWALRLLNALAVYAESQNNNLQLLLEWINALLSVHATIIRRCIQNRRILPGSSNMPRHSSSSIATALRRIESVIIKSYTPILRKALDNIENISTLPLLVSLASLSIAQD